MAIGDIERRSFIKLAAVAGVSVSFGGVLSGCVAGDTTSESSDADVARDSQPENAAAVRPQQEGNGASMIFINSSRSKNGNTASMGHTLLEGMDYEQIDLIDYKIYPLGQNFDDDQFEEVWAKMTMADTIVIGTPVYWHTMAGSLKLLIDRMYDKRGGELAGKRLAFFAQGGGPTQASLDNLVYTFERVAANYDMELVGTATSSSEVSALHARL